MGIIREEEPTKGKYLSVEPNTRYRSSSSSPRKSIELYSPDYSFMNASGVASSIAMSKTSSTITNFAELESLLKEKESKIEEMNEKIRSLTENAAAQIHTKVDISDQEAKIIQLREKNRVLKNDKKNLEKSIEGANEEIDRRSKLLDLKRQAEQEADQASKDLVAAQEQAAKDLAAKEQEAARAKLALETKEKEAQEQATQAAKDLAAKETELDNEKLAKTQAKAELVNERNSLRTAKQTINNYENYLQTILGINNFNNLPNNNTGQSLQQLINHYNNPPNQNQIISLQNQLNQIQQELRTEKDDHKQTKTKLHAIPSNWQQQIAEANENKKQIEGERDNRPTQQELDDWKLRSEQLKNDYQSQLVKQEKQTISKLNSDLDLNLQEPNLEQVIARIQQLISKPPKEIYQEFNDGELEQELSQANQTISRLEKELTPFGEDLAVIKELELASLEQLFNQAIDSDIQQQITQATSYQQVVSARQAFIQQQLGERQNIPQVVNQPSQELNKPLNQEKVILISALVASLLSVGGLMMKLKSISGSKGLRK